MKTSIASVAYYANGSVYADFQKELADQLGRMKLISFTNDERGARLELSRVFNGHKGLTTKGGRRHWYRFGGNKERTGLVHTFGMTPATVSIHGETLVVEVDKAQHLSQPLANCLRDLLAAA